MSLPKQITDLIKNFQDGMKEGEKQQIILCIKDSDIISDGSDFYVAINDDLALDVHEFYKLDRDQKIKYLKLKGVVVKAYNHYKEIKRLGKENEEYFAIETYYLSDLEIKNRVMNQFELPYDLIKVRSEL